MVDVASSYSILVLIIEMRRIDIVANAGEDDLALERVIVLLLN